MSNTWTLCVILVALTFTSSLVHYTKMPTWAEGCVGYTKELRVGEFEKDPAVCGILVCMSLDGDAIIYFCQKPVLFQNCDNDTVSLTVDYPDCCWQCTESIQC